MVPPLPPRPPKKPQRHNWQVLSAFRANGDVRGWFGLVQKGRPKKAPTTESTINDDASTVSDLTASTGSTGTTTLTATVASDATVVTYHQCRMNWSTEENFPKLLKAVVSVAGRIDAVRDPTGAAWSEADIILQEGESNGIPRQTLTRKLEQFNEISNQVNMGTMCYHTRNNPNPMHTLSDTPC